MGEKLGSFSIGGREMPIRGNDRDIDKLAPLARPKCNPTGQSMITTGIVASFGIGRILVCKLGISFINCELGKMFMQRFNKYGFAHNELV